MCTKWFSKLFSKAFRWIIVPAIAVFILGCGSNPKSDDLISRIGLSVPLASLAPCGQAALTPTSQQITGPDGQCYIATFIGSTSQYIQLPFGLNEIQSIRLEVTDSTGRKQTIAHSTQDISSIQSGQSASFLFLTDVQNPNVQVARISVNGSQAFVEVDLTGSQTMGQLYQAHFQSQTTIEAQLVFAKKQ